MNKYTRKNGNLVLTEKCQKINIQKNDEIRNSSFSNHHNNNSETKNQ